MKKSCPECYGHYRRGGKYCGKCRYKESCNYYTVSESSMKRRSHWVSYEAAEEIIANGGAVEPQIFSPVRKTGGLIPALGDFFRYLLELDDYTIGLIREIIVPSVNDGKPLNIRKLSRLRGCSRQALHYKILRTIALHPELAALFQGVMEKLPAGRRSFLRKIASGT